MTCQQKTILYIDDDPDDRELLSDAIKHANPEVNVVLTENGLEALSYLGKLKTIGDTFPCLIVLDINMPYLDGKQTFERLRSDKVLQEIPVLVFSSSEKPADKVLFNNLGIEFYTKPTTLSDMGQIVNHMISVCS